MPTTSATRTVLAAPNEVWARLAEFDRIVEWAPTVDHSEAMSEQPFGLGSARRVQVGRLTLVETVTVWDESEQLTYSLEGLPPFVDQATNGWTLEPAGEDRTTVTLTADVVPGSKPPMKLAAAVLARVIDRGNRRMLDGLVADLEGSLR